MGDHKVAEAIGFLLLMAGLILFVNGYSSPSCDQGDGLTLTPLGHLNLGSPATDQELFNSTFRSEALASFEATAAQTIPQTATSYYDSSRGYSNLSLSFLEQAPPWLTQGITGALNNTIFPLFAAIASAGSPSQGASQIEAFASTVSGYSISSINFVSYNGISAIEQYFQTGSIDSALCVTFPGQIGQLYRSAFDPTVPIDLRAHYLGQALAITAFIALVGGKDGFSAKFSDALDSVDLTDAWPTIKPYLYDIGSKVSEEASAAVLSILQSVASHFPTDSVWATGLTVYRINAMVDSIQQDGLPNTVVDSKIQDLVHASGNPSSEDSIANAADSASYATAGDILVKVRNNDNKLDLYDNSAGRTQPIDVAFLQKEMPGFNPKGPDFVQIRYLDLDETIYNYFPARSNPLKSTWLPSVPDTIASSGQVLRVSFTLLTQSEFVQAAITGMGFVNPDGEPWVADFSAVKSYTLAGDNLKLTLTQYPEVDDISNTFTLQGTVSPLKWAAGDTYVTITVPDVVSEQEVLKLTYDGNGFPQLSFQSGSNFGQVQMISSDGVRLRIVYSSGGGDTAIATIYLQDPSELYTLSPMQPGSNFGIASVSEGYQISDVTLNRPIENAMLQAGDPYDLGRLGAEIAYTVGKEDLSLKSPQLNEPSQSGPDLQTTDGTTVIQARFLDFEGFDQQAINGQLQTNLQQMTGAILKGMNLASQANVKVGYAILSYYTTNGIQTIILEVPRPTG